MFKTFDEEKMLKIPDDAFTTFYDQWIEKLYDHLTKKEEKSQSEIEEIQRIENYVMSKAGMTITIE
jgi:hypothetical protein